MAHLRKEMLCLAGRNFFGYRLWGKARAPGADLLWRIKKKRMLPCQKRLEGLQDSEPVSRLLTTILDHEKAPAEERAAQEFYGLLMAHFAIRGLMQEAALPAGFLFFTPSELSAASFPSMPLFPPRRRIAFHEAVLDAMLDEPVAARRGRRNRRGVRRGVKRKMSSYPLARISHRGVGGRPPVVA